MLTQALAANGCKVYITGRRLEVLETAARIHGSSEKLGSQGGSIHPVVMDVTSKESIKGVVDHITKAEGYLNLYIPVSSNHNNPFAGHVDVHAETDDDIATRLVNNAGVWTTMPSIKPEAGPEAFGIAMFDESMDAWQKGQYQYIPNQFSIGKSPAE